MRHAWRNCKWLGGMALLLVTVASIVASGLTPPVANASSAQKVNRSGAGPFHRGDTVNLEIRVPKLTAVEAKPFEVVFVVDASPSMNQFIQNSKATINTFVDDLSDYYGGAKVGIISFGYRGSASDPLNDPNVQVVYPLTLIDSSSKISSLKSAVNSLKGSPNDNFSDIYSGLVAGNNMFTSDANVSGRYLALMSDGLHNYPASGSSFYGVTSWNGKCPLGGVPNTETPNIGALKYTKFIIVPGGDPSTSFDRSYDSRPGAPKYFKAPCPIYDPYPSFTGMDFLTKLDAKFPNAGRAASMDAAILDISRAVTVTGIEMTDELNPTVFGAGSIINGGDVYNCATGSAHPSSNNLIQGTGGTIYSSIYYRATVSEYCVRFSAKINNTVNAGGRSINTLADPDERIIYKNYYGDIVGTNGILRGNIQIEVPSEPTPTPLTVNLQPYNFRLTDAAGNAKTTFNPGEKIYVRTNIRNVGTGPSATGPETRYYKNAPSTLSAGSGTTPEMWMTTASYSAGTDYDYESFPGGTKETYFNSVSGNRYWTISTPGTYTARVYVNYLEAGGTTPENDYADNQATVTYTISTPPPGDLTLTKFETTDPSGTVKRVFSRNETIYARIDAGNIGTTDINTPVQTQLYANRPSVVPIGSPSDTQPNPMYIQHITFPAGSSYEYESYPGGSFEGGYNGSKYWRVPASTGVLTARAYINYDQGATESNYGNNQRTVKYGVVVPPTSPTATPLSCRLVRFDWGGGDGASSFRIHLVQSGGPTEDFVAGASGPTHNLPDGPHSYTWMIYPRVNIDGTDYEGAGVAGNNFSTTGCPSFNITVPTTDIRIGNPTDAIANATISYQYPAAWNAGSQINLVITDIVAGHIDCSVDYLGKERQKITPPKLGITAGFSGGANQIAVPAPSTPGFTVYVKADAAAAPGQYTVCIGGWSTGTTTDDKLGTLHLNLNMAGWLQIAGDTDTAKGAGDFHSNGGVGTIVVPAAQYFFRNSMGVLSNSNLSMNIVPSGRLSVKNWLWKNYPEPSQPISSPQMSYLSLLTEARRDATLTSMPDGQNLANEVHCGESNSFLVNGDAILQGSNIQLAPGCKNNLVFFVSGDLNVQSDLTDNSNGGTVLFIINGNLTVADSVGRMDGMYLFGGRFDDTASSKQLIIHGSLIGLPGASPTNTTGSFSNSSGQSGLARDLGAAANQTTPAELIYYQPKYLYLMRNSIISGSTYSWVE